MVTKLMPVLTGTACVCYCYGWWLGTVYPAYVPLIWCFGCFVNDFYNWLKTP